VAYSGAMYSIVPMTSFIFDPLLAIFALTSVDKPKSAIFAVTILSSISQSPGKILKF
jgi:hypothetical protein